MRAVDGVDLTLAHSETLALVGESGCGKSVTGLSIMRLVQRPGRIVEGRIRFCRPGGVAELRALPERALRRIRGREIAMIFQDPMTSLDPLFTVGEQIAETLRLHERLPRAEAWRRAVGLLETVEIPSAARRAADYPHHLSGGMRQRVMIALALSCRPALLIADEPTTALDVTVQAQVLRLMKSLQERLGSSILFITHDMGVVGQVAEDVIVMYLGQVVEEGPVNAVLSTPAHPYTQGLIASIPTLTMPRHEALRPIAGVVPPIGSITSECRFRTRCPYSMPICESDPPVRTTRAGTRAACWLIEENAA